ncbi:MAG: hypothetical protein RJB38_2093 [Pseudomonadota bacterium]|jgi:hypothetical protein
MKIGIALAAYEPRPEFLHEQLSSILAQTHQDWVCHVTFDSPVLQPVLDQRITYRQNTTRLGLAKNFERAMNLCAQDPDVKAIAFCDQDDIWNPQKLELTLKQLQRAPSLSLVHCDLIPFDDERNSKFEPNAGRRTVWQLERRRPGPHRAEEQMIRCTVNGNTTLFDAELARSFPVFPEAVLHHDQWMTVLAATFGGVYEVTDALVHYRQHDSNVSGINAYRGPCVLPSNPVERIRLRNREFRAICTAVSQLELPVRIPSRFDLLKIAVSNLASDPVLARASISKFLGSFFPVGDFIP